MRVLKLAATVAPAALMLSACNLTEEKDAGAPPEAAADNATAMAAATPATSSLWNGGNAKTLDIQVPHSNGTVLQLTSLKSEPTSTVIGLRVMNGRDRDIELNRWNSRQGYILLDNGERLYMSPPTSNPRLSIPAGQSFEGELVFLGRLPPVQSAMLVLNENADVDNQYTTTPGFRIDLPVAASAPAAAPATPAPAAPAPAAAPGAAPGAAQ